VITQKELKNILHYNPKNGVFIWSKKISKKINTGDIAGDVNKRGYCRIGIRGKKYASHILAWIYIYGEAPENDLDHIDHNKTNNKISNLRIVTPSENAMNQTMSKANKSGFNGVVWNKKAGKWMVQIAFERNQIYLGIYDDIHDAIEVRKEANIKYGFHTNHGRYK